MEVSKTSNVGLFKAEDSASIYLLYLHSFYSEAITNPPFWNVALLSCFPPPQTSFKIKAVVEGF